MSRDRSWTPSERDYQTVTWDQNPWLTDPNVPQGLAYDRERFLGSLLWHRLQNDEPRRFQVVLGPRRVGKTTCLYQTVRHLLRRGVAPDRLHWLRLDHPLLMQQPLGALVRRAIEGAATRPTHDDPLYLFLDELTSANQWHGWLKTFHDDRWPVRIAASSSSAAELTAGRIESGAGRWDELFLGPYLFTEFLDLVSALPELPTGDTLADTIELLLPHSHEPLDLWRKLFLFVGGFPELLVAVDADRMDTALLRSQRTLREDAIQRAVYRDIPLATGIHSPLLLERLLYSLAGRIGGLLSPQNISRDIEGLNVSTLNRYLVYLQQSYLVFTLSNYTTGARQRRGRKLFFLDSAVRNAALQRGLGPLRDNAEMGLLTENLAASQLHNLATIHGVGLHYWRDGNVEVDLVYDEPGQPVAFEVGLSARHDRGNLALFLERFPRFSDAAYVVAPNAPPRRPAQSMDGIGSLPLDTYLLAIGAHARKLLESQLAGG